MTQSYCLTVSVKSPSIEHGLGYMIAFTLPDASKNPQILPAFSQWCEEVKTAVLRAGDGPFNPDDYTRKLAVAELMNDLEKLNTEYPIQVGMLGKTPAVRIQSSNPFDPLLVLNFDPEGGSPRRTEVQNLYVAADAHVYAAGRVTVIEADAANFPFERQDPAIGSFKKKTPPYSPRP